MRRQKNDRADAAAICEAVSRPNMRFAGLKTIGQQTVQTLHRSRELLIKQRVQLSNAMRAHLAEFGWVVPQGRPGLDQAMALVKDSHNAELPPALWDVLRCLVTQLEQLRKAIAQLNKQMVVWHRSDTESQRLAGIPGIGVVTASAVIASIGSGKQFKSGREFAAWVGLVPRQLSSGGKEKLGRISKQGNRYLRQLLVAGATTYLRGRRCEKAVGGTWFSQLLQRKPGRLASVALANKMARVVWAVLTTGEFYRSGAV